MSPLLCTVHEWTFIIRLSLLSINELYTQHKSASCVSHLSESHHYLQVTDFFLFILLFIFICHKIYLICLLSKNIWNFITYICLIITPHLTFTLISPPPPLPSERRRKRKETGRVALINQRPYKRSGRKDSKVKFKMWNQ